MLLAGLGLGGYFGTGTSSLTALIPAAFGVGLTGLGVMARDAGKRKLAMHIAVAVAAVGFIACVPGLFKLPMLLVGQDIPRPAAVISQSAMAVVAALTALLWYLTREKTPVIKQPGYSRRRYPPDA